VTLVTVTENEQQRMLYNAAKENIGSFCAINEFGYKVSRHRYDSQLSMPTFCQGENQLPLPKLKLLKKTAPLLLGPE